MALTVVFDQDCGVCTASVEWLQRRDRTGALHFVGNQGALPQGVPAEETGETIFVVDEARGLVWRRARAIAQALCALPGLRALPLRLAGWTMRVPGISWIADQGYRAFAARRHRVSAALGMHACKIPARRATTPPQPSPPPGLPSA